MFLKMKISKKPHRIRQHRINKLNIFCHKILDTYKYIQRIKYIRTWYTVTVKTEQPFSIRVYFISINDDHCLSIQSGATATKNITKNYRPGMNAMDLYYTVLQVIRMCILLKPCYKFKLLINNLTNPLSDFLLNRLLMRIISCKSAKNGWALKITKTWWDDGNLV